MCSNSMANSSEERPLARELAPGEEGGEGLERGCGTGGGGGGL